MFKKPRYIFPTLRATKRTLVICDSLYGKSHHKNGKANAFRHAIWNVLICQKVFDISKDEIKAITWSDKVTTLHEKLAPNEDIPKAMDLHNNQLGREYFKELKDVIEPEVIAFIEDKVTQAKLVIKIEDTVRFSNDLVYLLE
ncbi:hypothetical protein SAMN04487910_0995 [Aquimarina amphilecti]|uniref:DUF6973 domain-containing protein n=2 Tax=Aquimarina amphilecti TaxID=1038014 RepID=A0A1H7JKZ8_AQUAM|nr:hypothetical protein SAMN04487910_0995 [Aquimarina amphilecti]